MTKAQRMRILFVLTFLVVISGALFFWLKMDSGSTSPVTAKVLAKLERARHKASWRAGLPEPFMYPSEAEQYNYERRLPPGAKVLPYERYRQALDHMTQMPRYSTRLRKQVSPFTLEELSSSRISTGKTGSSSSFDKTAQVTVPLDTWSELGPGNIGGRTRAILIDPTDPNVMYAGGVAGGVWKTVDAGSRWDPTSDLLANIAINSMAMEPGNSSALYAGTGEGVFNRSAVRGNGIFKSSDAAASWSHLSFTRDNPDFYFVNKLVVSPKNSLVVYAATRTGVWRSPDGGTNWARIHFPESKVNPGELVRGGCLDLALRTDQAEDLLFASCGTFEQSSIYRTLNAAAATPVWTEVKTESAMGRTILAIAPSNQSIIYALAASSDVNSQFNRGLLAMFRSVDGGNTWTAQVRNTDLNPNNQTLLSNPAVFVPLRDACGITGGGFLNQGWYDNIVAVDPVNPDRVWAGGIDLFRSTDGGQNWFPASYWHLDPANPRFAHADQHSLVFHPGYNGTTNQILYAGNDGGVYRTGNAVDGTTEPDGCEQFVAGPLSGTLAWQGLNNNYGVTQFYFGTAYPGGATYFGGTQDNGTLRGNDVDGSEAWETLFGGDGGHVAVDPTNPSTIYVESQGFGSFARSDDGGANFFSKKSGVSEGGGSFLFIPPFTLDPNNPRRLWVGGQFLWRTDNRADEWSRASTEIPQDPANFPDRPAAVSAIAVAAGNSGHVLVGTSHGHILRNDAAGSADSTTDWTVSRPRAGLASWIAFDPRDESIVYATYSSFNSALETGHIFKSLDGGSSWTNIDGVGATGIPDIPVHSIAVDLTDSLILYSGTDVGVFVSRDGGSTWAVENTGFANVKTEALASAKIGKVPYLFAFTHGRGVYRVATNDAAFNSVPVAAEDSFIVGTGLSQEITLLGFDPDVEDLTFSIETAPTNGSLSALVPVNGTSATVTYTASASIAGPDSFVFRVADAAADFATATVTLDVLDPAPVPVVDSLVPASAEAGGAAFSLTVNGNGFNSQSVVHWHNLVTGDSSTRDTSFVNETQLFATILASDILNTDPSQVFVVTPAPGGGTSNIVDFTIFDVGSNPIPILSSIVPGFAIAGDPGVTLSVQGQDFVDGSIVRWNGLDRLTTFVSATVLSADISAGDIAVKTVATVTVFNPSPGGGISNAIDYQVYNPGEANPTPDYTSINPNSARAGDLGVTVTMIGGGFIPETIVRWNGADRPTTLISDTQVTVAIPGSDLTTEGQALVSVFNPGPGGGGVSKSPAGDFFILPAENRIPVLSTLDPFKLAEGDPGFLLQIFGSDFSVDSIVRWNGADRITTFISPTRLAAAILAADVSTAGLFDVTVFNPAPGGGTSNVKQAEVLTVAPVPVLQALEPTVIEGGGSVTIRGTGFTDGRSTVRIGSLPRFSNFISSTELQVPNVFSFDGGTFPVTVVNSAPGGGESNALDLMINNPVPDLQALSPASIIVGGGDFVLTLTGHMFNTTSIVRWDGADLTTTNPGNSSELTADVPAANLAAGGTAQVTVFNPSPGGGESAAVSFDILDFSLTASPGSGSTQPGGTASYTLTVSPQSGSFDQAVSFSCPNLAAVLSCAFAPATVTPGSAATTTTLTVTASANAFVFPLPELPNPYFLWMLSAALGLGLVAIFGTRQRTRAWIPAVALSTLLLLLSACGGGAPADPPRNFNITVAAASGSLERTTSVSLTVQ